ncbi:hypothetical protein R5R35_000401 [Gryllus longicercus]|uniref:Histone deacetylase 8 n=1 Tax=Gryllus longicercus TaxID=2509291 RepID=A0AAN9VC77_9ORTH
MNGKEVIYIYNETLCSECDRNPRIAGRATQVHELIRAYGLLDKMTVHPSRPAYDEEINTFHSSSYIDFLKEINSSSDLEVHEDEAEQFGLNYDCPLVERLYDFVKAIAGSSISGAEAIVGGKAKVAINWFGGWHHAQRDQADGYCYVNDIVLAIHKLRQKYKKILYIDLDAHHGDGVENAFAFSPSVLTFSLHKYEPCFYPGTGNVKDVGYGQGRYYSVNIPLADGLRDFLFSYVFDSVMLKIWKTFNPEVIVVQCGADGLSGDPTNAFNLTLQGFAKCVKTILSWNLPTMFLGGGGYNHPNVARCWTYLTSLIVEQEIKSSIPDHEYFMDYGPDFELDILPGCRKDNNSKESLDSIIQCVSDNLDYIG